MRSITNPKCVLRMKWRFLEGGGGRASGAAPYLRALFRFGDRNFRNCEMRSWGQGHNGVHEGGDFCCSLNLEQQQSLLIG